MERLSGGPKLTVTRIRDYLEAHAISVEMTESRSSEATKARYSITGGGHGIH